MVSVINHIAEVIKMQSNNNPFIHSYKRDHRYAYSYFDVPYKSEQYDTAKKAKAAFDLHVTKYKFNETEGDFKPVPSLQGCELL